MRWLLARLFFIWSACLAVQSRKSSRSSLPYGLKKTHLCCCSRSFRCIIEFRTLLVTTVEQVSCHWNHAAAAVQTEKSNSILHTFLALHMISKDEYKTNFKSWCSCNHANPCSTKSDISARVQLHRSMTYQGSLWTSVRPSHLKDSLIRQRPLMLIIWWGNGSSPDDENYELVFDRWPRQLYCKVIITIFLEEGHLLSCWKNEKQCLSIWRYYRASSP